MYSIQTHISRTHRCMQTCDKYTHPLTHTIKRSHAGKRNVTLSLLCQPLFVSSPPPLSLSSLSSSNCASLHPWPCYLLEHLKETGRRGRRENLWSSFVSQFLFFPRSFISFITAFATTKHSWRIRFTPIWHLILHGYTHAYRTCTHKLHTEGRCDEHINAGFWIGWSSIVSELFEEVNQQIYECWEITQKHREMWRELSKV